MSDNRKSGLALILGSVGGMVTMAIHPVPGGSHGMAFAGLAHSLALVSVLVLFLGGCGLTRALAAPDRLAFCALVTFGFACVAVMIAAAVSGWVAPDMMAMMDRDIPSAQPMWQIAIASMFRVNQAMSRIYSIGTALAILLWSISSLRRAKLSTGFAWYGCIASPLVALLILVGHLRLNVHGMTVVMLSEVIWFVGMGTGLWHRLDHYPANFIRQQPRREADGSTAQRPSASANIRESPITSPRK